MNMVVYIFHIGGGTIGLASGLIAAFSRKTGIFFLPQLLVLCFLVFWMIRVRFPGRRQA